MKKTWLLLLPILLILFISACTETNREGADANDEPDSSPQQQAAPADTSPDSLESYSLSVCVSNQRELTVVLNAEPTEDDYFPVSSILVYDGERLLQTLEVPSVPPVGHYAWDGLFVNEGDVVGEPDVRDVNFDGAEDFGLLAVSAYPKNVPYSYFVWNKDTALFEYSFTLFGAAALEVDANEQRLIETSHDTMGTYKAVYKYLSDGTLYKTSADGLSEVVPEAGAE